MRWHTCALLVFKGTGVLMLLTSLPCSNSVEILVKAQKQCSSRLVHLRLAVLIAYGPVANWLSGAFSFCPWC
jgi:hypothetical protein